MFWLDNWVGNEPLIKYMNPNKKEDINIQQRVCKYIRHNKTWNVELLSQVIPSDIVRQILSILMPTLDIPDRVTWKFTQDENFSLKSVT